MKGGGKGKGSGDHSQRLDVRGREWPAHSNGQCAPAAKLTAALAGWARERCAGASHSCFNVEGRR